MAITRRQAVPVLFCGIVLLTLAAAAYAAPASEATESITLSIPQWMDVTGGPITTWGQGHTSKGMPGPNSGALATFEAGLPADPWPGGLGDVPFSNGAVGRSDLTIHTNTQWGVKVKTTDVSLDLDNDLDPAKKLLAYAHIGYQASPTADVLLQANWNTLGQAPTGNDGSSKFSLYCTVQRKGLDDAAGIYSSTAEVQVYHYSSWGE